MAMVEVRDLNRTYNIVENGQLLIRQVLYHSLNLTIEEGEFVAITGPSGCGKTTLLNIIGMLDSVQNRRYVKVHFEGTQQDTRIPEVEGGGYIFIDNHDITAL